jgi:hypothetical protein
MVEGSVHVGPKQALVLFRRRQFRSGFDTAQCAPATIAATGTLGREFTKPDIFAEDRGGNRQDHFGPGQVVPEFLCSL